MIVDAHCHIWDEAWPPLAPDALAGRLERLLHLMDSHGVAKAVVVAHLDQHDPDNNRLALAHARAHPDRLAVLANVHLPKPDAGERLSELLDQPGLAGISYYLEQEDAADWLMTDATAALWERIAAARLAVNLSIRPWQMVKLGRVLAAYRTVPFLLCHLGHPRLADGLDNWKPLIDLAAHPNAHIKVSGFAYVIGPTGAQWEYPYTPVLPAVRALVERYGAARLMWGSDYPPTMRYMTYRQSLEVVRTHCSFLTGAEKTDLLGETARRVLRL